MNLLKKCLIEFNNQWTNKITEKEVDDDEQLTFTLLDMQKFAKKYVEAIDVIQCCKSVKITEKQQKIEAITALTEVVKANNKLFVSERTMEIANSKIKELIQQL
jgi:hypothetical protein